MMLEACREGEYYAVSTRGQVKVPAEMDHLPAFAILIPHLRLPEGFKPMCRRRHNITGVFRAWLFSLPDAITHTCSVGDRRFQGLKGRRRLEHAKAVGLIFGITGFPLLQCRHPAFCSKRSMNPENPPCLLLF